MANKIEDICVSLGTAKRLQEAGIVVDTIYEWEEQYLLDELIYTKLYKKHETIDQYGYHYRHYPAPTAEEFERFITSDYNDNVTKIDAITNGGNVSVGIHNYEKKTFYQGRWHAKKTEALAEIALRLKENVKSEGAV